MTEAIHPLSKQLFFFCLSTTRLINLLLQLFQVSLAYQCVLRLHISLVFVCHVGDTHTSFVHYFSLPNNIFNVWQSHHYNPSVCSLCSSCFLSPSNSSHLSVYNVLYVWTTGTCLPAAHEGGKSAGQEEESFSPLWHQHLHKGNKHGAFN